MDKHPNEDSIGNYFDLTNDASELDTDISSKEHNQHQHQNLNNARKHHDIEDLTIIDSDDEDDQHQRQNLNNPTNARKHHDIEDLTIDSDDEEFNEISMPHNKRKINSIVIIDDDSTDNDNNNMDHDSEATESEIDEPTSDYKLNNEDLLLLQRHFIEGRLSVQNDFEELTSSDDDGDDGTTNIPFYDTSGLTEPRYIKMFQRINDIYSNPKNEWLILKVCIKKYIYL